jgi:hypothetical protein
MSPFEVPNHVVGPCAVMLCLPPPCSLIHECFMCGGYKKVPEQPYKVAKGCHAHTVTFQALHKSLFTQYLKLCKLPTTLVVFTSVIKGTFPGQSEGVGSINIIRNIAIKLGDFDGVARARRAHFRTHNIQVSVPRHTPCYSSVTVTLVSKPTNK